ncbi:MAG: SMP-30/gluconolactonase/LRE family protein [Actinobacteria bacterium]|nr:SMP-30/gluconolactonase/LRE family protein [Actinomycetota bacterium]
MEPSVEQVTAAGAVLGEGPVWDDRYEVLWWVDITGRRLHRFDVATGVDESRELPVEVGAVVPRTAGGLVFAQPDGFAAFDWTGGPGEHFAAVEAKDRSTRMNDGKCDARGRFWAGTMAYDFAQGAGALYCLEADRTVRKALGDVTISNGLAWSSDASTMFYIDSAEATVDAFDFDIEAGTLAKRRSIVRVPEPDGIPDGMAIDSEGYLWVALFGGGAVHRYSSDGRLDTVLTVPAPQVTSCAFAGPDLADLYITTAAHGYTEAERADYPVAGALFRCRPGVAGAAVGAYAG